MIIYNSNKEFIGIDAQDLKALGFKNLASLQAESADFADLFVKTPGHVHNFKHVHWIDFVLCAKSTQESKAIIHANDKNFKVTLEVKTIYLNDSPSSAAFIVILNNLRSLSVDEKSQISGELQTRIAPSAALMPTAVTRNNNDSIDVTLDNFDTDIVNDPYATTEDEVVDIYELTPEELEHIGEAEVDDAPIELDDGTSLQEEVVEEKQVQETLITIDDSEDVEEFIFDPQRTAEALEMPISLIEEFIEDFISQAKEFKNHLYNAIATDDMIELQAYSHKLKGVAANLRVNDALEILDKINKAKDFTTSKKDLDTFYKIISKLSGEKVAPKKATILDDDSISSLEEEPIRIKIEDDDELLEIIDDDLDLIEIADDEEDDEPLLISDDFDMLDDAIHEIIEEDEPDVEPEIKLKIYSQEVAANEIGINHEIFKELFDDYINESQELITQINDAIFNNTPDIWKDSAIKLKGMSDNMRIDSFKTNLEVLITTKDADDAKDALRQIQSTIFNILEKKD